MGLQRVDSGEVAGVCSVREAVPDGSNASIVQHRG
jgi:hypothetical protein